MLTAIRAIIRNNLPKTISGCSAFSTSPVVARGEDRKQMLASVPKKDEGTVGENAIAIDSLITE